MPPSVEMLCFPYLLFINEFRNLSAISMFLSDNRAKIMSAYKATIGP